MATPCTGFKVRFQMAEVESESQSAGGQAQGGRHRGESAGGAGSRGVGTGGSREDRQ